MPLPLSEGEDPVRPHNIIQKMKCGRQVERPARRFMWSVVQLGESNSLNNFSISSKGIGDAMLRSASALHAAGNTIDESIALITAANRVAQNPEAVGTAMKSLSMYLRAAKSEAEDAGEITDGMASSVSELRAEILALTGQKVDIQVDENTFKSTVQIIGELSKVWDELTDVSRANILELIGGKRNSNVIVALIENFEQVEEIIESSSKSAGSALKENEKYLESINGKISVLKSSIQELSTNALNDGLVKDVVDIMTRGIELVNAFEGTSTILPWITLLGLFASKPFEEAAKSSANLVGTLKTVWGNAGWLGKIGMFVQGVSLLLTLLDMIPGIDLEGWFRRWTSTAEERIDDTKSSIEGLVEKMNSAASELRELNSSYDDIVPKYLELFEKAGETTGFNKQGNLSDEEYEEFLDLQNRIAEMFPELDLGIDSNGNHMLALSGNIDAVSQSLENMLELYQKLKMQEIADSFGDNLEQFSQLKKDYQYAANEANFNWAHLRTNKKNIEIDPETAWRVADDFAESDIEKEALKKARDESDTEWLRAFYDRKIEYYELERQLYLERLAHVFDGLNASIPALIQADPVFSELDAAMQDVALKLSTGLDLNLIFSDLENVTEQDVKDYFGKFLLAIQNANLEGLAEGVLSGAISSDTALAILSRDMGNIDGSLKQAVVSSFKEMGYEVASFDDVLRILIDDYVEYKKLAEDTDESAPSGGDSEGLKNLKLALAGTKTELEEVQDAIDKFSTEGFDSLSEDEFKALLETLPGVRTELLAVANAAENGNLSLEEQAAVLKKLKDAANNFKKVKIAEAIEDIAKAADDYGKDSAQLQDAMAELAQICPEVAEALWDAEKGMYDLSGATGTSADAIRQWILVSISAKVAELQAELSALKGSFLETAAAAAYSVSAINTIGGNVVGGKIYTTDSEGQIEQQGGGLKVFGAAANELNASRQQETLIASKEDQLKMWNEYMQMFTSMDFSASSGGGSSKTPADTLKEKYDALATSLEYCIQEQEQYFEQGKKSLDSEAMRSALAREVGYYKEIQVQAQAALDAARAYYQSQGLSDAAIEQESVVQDLKQTTLDATQDVENALDRMTSAITEAFSSAVDDIQNVYNTLHSAADEFASSGFITIDTYQSIVALGVEYLAMLKDENGQLVINEENIKKIMAARVEQMAVESALAYVEALRTAQMTGNTEELNRLLYATQDTTGATWGLVYASLGLLDLESDAYRAALNNINALRSLADSAIDSIGRTTGGVTDGLKEMQTGLNDILDYVMDMIKDETDAQIDAIEKQKDAFSEYIEMRKEALDTAKEETDYEEQKAELLKEIANLQSDIDALDLIGTREAEAQKAALLEEQSELQKELADLQGEYAYDAQVDALDKMEEAYAESKDNEIEDLEAKISSEQKLYDLAITRIENEWETLKDQLIAWNADIGNSLTSEIETAWDRAYAAANRYGSFVSAMDNIQADIDATGSGNNYVIGNTKYDDSHTDQDSIEAIVWRMKQNSYNWFDYTNSGRNDAAAENKRLASQLSQYGVKAVIGDDGVWYIDHIGGQRLYDVYHTGGVVGGGTLKQKERYALLEEGETVLTEKAAETASSKIKVLGRLSDMLSSFFGNISSSLPSVFPAFGQRADVSQVSNANRSVTVTFGDTYITGADSTTIKKHQDINKGFMDELARQLGVKW